MVSGKGSKLTDADGNSYVDLVGSWGPMILGHADPEVTAAAAVKPLVATSSPADASSRSANIQPTPTPTAGSSFTPTTHGKEASAAVATPIAPEAAAQPAPAAHDPPATLPRGQDQTATRGDRIRTRAKPSS